MPRILPIAAVVLAADTAFVEEAPEGNRVETDGP